MLHQTEATQKYHLATPALVVTYTNALHLLDCFPFVIIYMDYFTIIEKIFRDDRITGNISNNFDYGI